MPAHRSLVRVDVPEVDAADEALAAVVRGLDDGEAHFRRGGEWLLALLLEVCDLLIGVGRSVRPVVLTTQRAKIIVDGLKRAHVVGRALAQRDEAAAQRHGGEV